MSERRGLREMLEEYTAMAREYHRFMLELEATFGSRIGIAELPGADAAKRQRWEDQMRGAERILGHIHADSIRKEVGLAEMAATC